jgi:uncharacterized protein
MTRLLCIVALVLAALTPASSVQLRGTTASVDPCALAEQFVDQLASGDLDSVSARFDDTMREAVCASGLQSVWQSIVSESGQFKKRAGTRTKIVGDYTVVFVRCEFENDATDVRVALSISGQVHAVFFAPSESAAQYRETSGAESPINPTVNERDVTVGTGEWPLPATLTLPGGSGAFPALVMVHGFGPSDKDELSYANRPFRDLARGLAARGIATLRYDKQTFAHDIQIALIKNLTVKQEVLDDVVLALGLLRNTNGVDPGRVFVLGHSQGGTLAPRIAKLDPDLAGLIVMAGPTRPLEDVILEQINYLASLDDTITDVEKARIKDARHQAARAKDGNLSLADPPIFGVPTSYWLDLRDYHPFDVAQQIAQPMLILQGERDYQVGMDDFRYWQKELASRPHVTCKSYPGLNHFFIEGHGKPSLEELRARGQISETVIDDIAEWVKRQPAVSVVASR